jgi:hypothetical protein
MNIMACHLKGTWLIFTLTKEYDLAINYSSLKVIKVTVPRNRPEGPEGVEV